MLPSIETLLTLTVPSSVEPERRLEPESFRDLFAIALGLFVLWVITAVSPTRRTLLAVTDCADVLYPNVITCIKHVRLFNLETLLNSTGRYRADILSKIGLNNSRNITCCLTMLLTLHYRCVKSVVVSAVRVQDVS